MRLRPLTALAAAFFCAALSPARADDSVSLSGRAAKMLEKGDYEQALESLRKGHELFPYNEGIKSNLASAYAAVGKKLMEKRDFEGAAEQFDRSRELYPDAPAFGAMRGIALYRAEKYDLARFELERSLALPNGRQPESLFFLGKVFYDTGDVRRAVELWEEAATLLPSEPGIKEMLNKARKEVAVEEGMDKGNSSRFLISYDSSVKPEIAGKILDELETAYNRIGSDFNHFPEAPVPVLLYTRREYKDLTASPDWSGGVYDGKIRIPVAGLGEITPHFRATLFHEYTHAVIRGITKGNCPVWLNEGLAEYEGRKEFDPPLKEFAAQWKNDEIPTFASLEGSFARLSGKDALIAYEQSYAMASFMVNAYGLNKIQDLLHELGKGLSFLPAVEKAFSDYQLTFADIEREWRASEAKELGDKN